MNFDHDIACENLGQLCDRPPSEVREIIFESDLQLRYESGVISTNEFHVEFCQHLNVDSAIDEVCLAASAIFSPNSEVIPIVANLFLSNCKLGILSNTCDAHWKYIFDGRYRFVNELFSKYALSFEMGCSKPDPAIYAKAADIAATDPNKIFFVDDRIENVEAAQKFGFDAVLFRNGTLLAKELFNRGLLASF